MSRSQLVTVVLTLALLAGGWLMKREAEAQTRRDGFASDREDPPKTPKPAPFDAKRAMGYLESICKIGPRISGSEGMQTQQELLEKHFKDLGGVIEWQRFEVRQHSQKNNTKMANLIVRWHPDRPRRVVLAAHYDTRPIADQEPNLRKWHDPFVSANDGGSGVALLMELAHVMKELPTSLGVDFVFFDGEEFCHERGDEYFFGSKHFAARYRKAKQPPRYIAGFVLDMIGGKNARFPIETNSWFHAAPLVIDLWNLAEELKCTSFQKREGPAVEDDHVPLNRAGIPTVDIIDFSYAHWHRLTDVPANCSGESLEQVARVLSVWLQKTK